MLTAMQNPLVSAGFNLTLFYFDFILLDLYKRF